MTVKFNITFISLQNKHFPLLLKWLETPHVKAWWDQDIVWTQKLIGEKYSSYVKGYKTNTEDNATKSLHAYIILANGEEIGYIQYYNAYDFECDEPITGLPPSLAAFDIFIGSQAFIGKGIGSIVIRQFCDEYIFSKFDHCLVDPDIGNISAIRAYTKAGFYELYRTDKVIMMIKDKQVKATVK